MKLKIALMLTAALSCQLSQAATLNYQLAYQLTEQLTTEIGPRLAGSPADRAAVSWAEKKMRELGFDRVWSEAFVTPYWQRGHARLDVISPFPQSMVLTALGGSIGTPDNGIDASVVMFDSLEALQAAKPEQVANKIVFINRVMTKDKQGSQYGKVVGARAKGAIEASRLGAQALIIRSVGTSQNRFAHTGKMTYDPAVKKIPAVSISAPDAEQLARILHKAPEARLKLKMDNSQVDDAVSHNVIGEMTGSERPNDIVLIGAHLDSWDLGTGALDDGAGVGLVMAAATLIKQQGRPKRTIRVVLYGNEEGGLVGARAYAAKHADELKNHVLASESDFGAGRIWQFQTKFGEKSLAVGGELAEKLKLLNITQGGNSAFGGPDVSVLAPAGVPLVSLEQDGTDYFDYHHTPNDTFDKIDPQALEQNLKAWVEMTQFFANSTVDLRQ